MMRDLKPGDRLKLITFNMRVTRIVDFTSDPSRSSAQWPRLPPPAGRPSGTP
jgi:hypothetical protein